LETTQLYESIRDGTLDVQTGAPSLIEELPPAPGLPPFLGLQYFEEADADLYFGREALVARLAGQLKEMPGGRFLAVVGASGSGKSSLVRAGLIPALRKGERLSDGSNPPRWSHRWLVHVITPTAHPLEALATSLTREGGSVSPTAALIDDLAQDPRSLHLYARRMTHLKRAPHLLLVVDQFEELFTLCRSERERTAFIENLLVAAGVESDEEISPGESNFEEPVNLRSGPDGPLVAVIALRADFYDHCSQYARLRSALSIRQEYIGSMAPDELRRSIEEPARCNEWEFEPGLVDLILREVSSEPGALPLLSHALLETWRRRRGRTLTLKGYAEAGGIHRAIAQTAESVYNGLPEGKQTLARRIFLRLTELGEGTQDTRRRASLSELAASPEAAPQVESVLNTLVEARLVTAGEGTVEVAHEALIREWPALRGWLEQDREGLRLQRHLTEAAQAWEAMQRDPGELYRGARLAQALEWAAVPKNLAALNPLERDFLNASHELEEQEIAEREARRQRELEAAQRAAKAEKLRAEQQARSAARLRRRAMYLVGALLLALVMAGAAFAFANRSAALAVQNANNASLAQTQQAIAEAEAQSRATQQSLAESEAEARATAEANAIQEGKTAQDQARLATSRELALAAINNLEVDPERSILLALQAYSTADTQQAEEALHRSVEASRIRLRLTGVSVAYSPDGTLIATGDKGGTLKFWDAQTGEEFHTFSGHSDRVQSLAFSPDGAHLASVSVDGTLRVWDVAQAKELLAIPAHIGSADNVFFSPDGTRLTTSGIDDKAQVWDAATGKLLLTVDLPVGGWFFPNSIGFLPNGDLLVANGFDEDGIRVVDSLSGQVIKTLPGYSPVAASPDGIFLATGDITDGDLMEIWDLPALLASDQPALIQPISTFQAHTNFIQGIAFSSAGDRLATTSLDGTAKVWQISPQGASLIANLYGYTSNVDQVALSPDGRRLATTGEDDSTRVWDVTAPGSGELLTLAGHIQQISGLAVQPQGNYLATSSWDEGTVEIWELPSGRLLLTFLAHTGGVWDLAFSPDGNSLATVGADNATRVWDLRGSLAAGTGKKVSELAGHVEAPPVGGVRPGTVAVDYSPDGKLLASAGADGQAVVWNLVTSQELLSLPVASQGVGATNLAFSPDGRRLATGSDSPDSVAKIWGLSTGKELLTLPEVSDIVRIRGLAWSPNCKRLAASGNNGIAKVWDASTGQELLNLSGHSGSILGLAFSPDGKLIASTGSDETTKLWDASTGLNLLTLTGQTGTIFDLAFSPDGRYLITASRDGTTQVDLVRIEDLITLAKTRVTRSLTTAECQQYLHQDHCPPNP
jgi:WD40 repeat protein